LDLQSTWIEDVKLTLSTWANSLDPVVVALVGGVAVLLILLRRPLARVATALTAALLEQLGLHIAPTVRKEGNKSFEALIYIGALFLALDGLAPPPVADGIVRQLLVGLLVIVLYSALFRRTDMLIELFLRRHGKPGLDTIWMSRILQLVIIALCFSTVLDVLGIDISGAVAGLGVLGAGLAIASQDFVRNLVAGMNNASERRFAPGDWISTDKGVEGTVVTMDLRSTMIVGFDRVPCFVPNNDLANSVLSNHSRRDHRRVYETIELSRDASEESVAEFCRSLEDYARSSGDFVYEEGVPFFVAAAGVSSTAVEVQLYFFTVTNDFEGYTRACGRLAMAIRASAKAADTDLAYPMKQVWLQTAPQQAGEAKPIS
jgi:MscS family membrane protein